VDSAEKVTTLGLAYELFNDRRFDQLLALMVEDVQWPDVAAGAVLVGRPAIRRYWETMFAVSNPRVLPREYVSVGSDVFAVVEQRISDLGGAPIAEPVVVYHRYSFRAGLITCMAFHQTRESAAESDAP
jgi:hypothetical protein